MKFQDQRFKKHLARRQKNKKLTSQEQFDLKFFKEMAEIEEAEKLSKSPKYAKGFDDSSDLKEIGK